MNKNNKKGKNKYMFPMVIPFVIGVICYSLYTGTENKIERLIILFVFITGAIPFTLQILNMLLGMMLKSYTIKGTQTKKVVDANGDIKTIQKTVSGQIHEKKEYKPNKEKDNDPKYLELRNAINSMSKSKQLKRKDLLEFKNELDYRLGNHRYNYTNFQFTNDMHEIYTKIKSSKLTDQDYDYLLTHLYSNTNIDIQEISN